jgi:hypothetical protein
VGHGDDRSHSPLPSKLKLTAGGVCISASVVCTRMDMCVKINYHGYSTDSASSAAVSRW